MSLSAKLVLVLCLVGLAAAYTPPALEPFIQQALPAAETGLWSEDTLKTYAAGSFNAQYTNFAFLPDGRLLVARKTGVIESFPANGGPATVWLNIYDEVHGVIDRGLVGMTVDPNFAAGLAYVYLMYTVRPDVDVGIFTPTFTRVARFEDVGGVGTNKFILIGNNFTDGICQCFDSHGPGDLHFGLDGTLFISHGDAASYQDADLGNNDLQGAGHLCTQVYGPLGQDIGAWRSQSLNSLSGKIIRIDPATGLGVGPSTGLVPNPYYDAANPNSFASKVWARGLRNPYRFAVIPGTPLPGWLAVGDVGYYTYEELNIVKSPGMNFGWPCWEGLHKSTYYIATNTCIAYYANVTGPDWPVFDMPHYSDPTIANFIGNCITAGFFYSGSLYPAAYQNALLFGDYGQGWLKAIWLNADGSLQKVQDWVQLTASTDIVKIAPHPVTGNLLALSYGGDAVQNKGRITEIVNAATAGNLPPTVVATASPEGGLVPLVVKFSSEGTYDLFGRPVSLLWDFGDGTPPSTAANPTHTFTVNGVYTVRLTVNTTGVNASDTVVVQVGNRPPVVTVLFPPDDYKFASGEVLTMRAAVSDPEDGTAIPFVWSVSISHVQHQHDAFTLANALNLTFVPSNTIHAPPDRSVLFVTLTATDTKGLSTAVLVKLRPNWFADNGPVNVTTAHCSSFGAAPLQTFFDFTGTMSANDDYRVYTINYGDGNSKQLPYKVVTSHYIYDTPGTYTATVSVRDVFGGTGAKSMTINVGAVGTTTENCTKVVVPPPAPTSLVLDYSFEQAQPLIQTTWVPYYYGYSLSSTAKDGVQSINCTTAVLTEQRGAAQKLTMATPIPAGATIQFTGWSLATNVIVSPVNTFCGYYAVYADVAHTDGTFTYGLTACFDPTVAGWQFKSRTWVAPKPVSSISLLAFFAYRSGSALFDLFNVSVIALPTAGPTTAPPATTVAGVWPITIDGNLADWTGAPTTVMQDRLGDGVIAVSGTDYAAYTLGWNDIDKAEYINQPAAPALYIRVQMLGNFAFAQCQYAIFIDADNNAATGYITQWGKTGAEYYWSGTQLYQYAGTTDRTAWAWSLKTGGVTQAVGTTQKNVMEIAILRTAASLGNTISMFFFFTDTKLTTTVYSDDVTDYMPDQYAGSPTCADGVQNGLETGVDCGGYCQTCSSAVSLLDNSVADWLSLSGVVSFPTDPCCNGYNNTFFPMAIDPSADIIGGWTWASATQVCARIQYLGNYNIAHVDMVFYIDKDANPNTGYKTSFNTIGADLLMLTGSTTAFLNYTGTGSDWSWSTLPLNTVWNYQVVGTNYEMCFSRALAGLLGGNTQLRWFIEGIDNKGTLSNFQDDVVNFYPYPGTYYVSRPCDSYPIECATTAPPPTTTAPVTTPPVTTKPPTTQPPTTQPPTTQPPTTPPVTTKPPTTQPPTTQPPTTQPPTTQPPTTPPVTTKPPTTQPPTTQPPTTQPPTTQPPTTQPPTTVPVTTKPPTTVPVTTQPPTTAPVTTQPPTTLPVTTQPPTTKPATTVPVTTQPPTTQPPTTPPTTQPDTTQPDTTQPDTTQPETPVPTTQAPLQATSFYVYLSSCPTDANTYSAQLSVAIASFLQSQYAVSSNPSDWAMNLTCDPAAPDTTPRVLYVYNLYSITAQATTATALTYSAIATGDLQASPQVQACTSCTGIKITTTQAAATTAPPPATTAAPEADIVLLLNTCPADQRQFELDLQYAMALYLSDEYVLSSAPADWQLQLTCAKLAGDSHRVTINYVGEFATQVYLLFEAFRDGSIQASTEMAGCAGCQGVVMTVAIPDRRNVQTTKPVSAASSVAPYLVALLALVLAQLAML